LLPLVFFFHRRFLFRLLFLLRSLLFLLGSRSFVTRRINIPSNCSSYSLRDFRLVSLFLFRYLFLFRLCSLVTGRLDIVGSISLVTRLVTSACSFASSCFFFHRRFLLRLLLFLLGSRSFVTGRVDIPRNCSSYSPRDFRLLSLFRFRYLSFFFLFRFCSLLLRLCRFLFFSFSLSLSLPFHLLCLSELCFVVTIFLLVCNGINYWWHRY
jgi:hypothetical protein